MLDGFAIHISHVQAAVRCIGELYWAKPVVARGDELAFTLIGRPFADRLYAGIKQLLAVNEITASIGNECIAREAFAQGIPAINRNTRGRGEIAGYPSAAFHRPAHLSGDTPARAHDAPGFIRAQPKHLRRRAIGRNADALAGQRIMRIAPRVARGIHQRLQMAAVAAGKLAAVIVEAHPVLRRAVFRAQFQRARIKGKIATTECHRFAGFILHAAAHV